MENWWVACANKDEVETTTRKGPWTVEEDMLLSKYIKLHGVGRWNFVAKAAGLQRTGRSCRLRWINYLRPDLKRSEITPEEECLIIELQRHWGNRWSRIAQRLPGRTDNEIKNYWRTCVKKKTNPNADNGTTGMHGDNRSAHSKRSKGSYCLRNSSEMPSNLDSTEPYSSFLGENTEKIEVETNKTPYLQDDISPVVIPTAERNYENALRRQIQCPSLINDDGKEYVTSQEHLEGLAKQNSLPFNFSVRSLATLMSSESIAYWPTQDSLIPTSFINMVASPEFSDNESYLNCYSDVLWNMEQQDDRFNHSRPREILYYT